MGRDLLYMGERARAGTQAVFLPVRSVNKGGVISWNEVHKGKRTCMDMYDAKPFSAMKRAASMAK